MGQLRARVATALTTRLSPENTRRATAFERYTVARLSPHRLVRMNRNLEFVGKVATTIWVCFLASLVVGVDWTSTVRRTLNGGKPIEQAVLLAIVVPTIAFLLARSMIGFARWRLQRELWRRDVAASSRELSDTRDRAASERSASR